MTFGSGVYRVRDPGAVTASDQRTREVRVPIDHGPLYRVGGPALLLIGVLGLVGFGEARRRGALAIGEDEREYLAYESAREEFDDWITTGRVPADAVEGTVVTVDSLEGLVDLAIDADRRVIEDVDGDRFVVFDGMYTYLYTPRQFVGGTVSTDPGIGGDGDGAKGDAETIEPSDREGPATANDVDGPVEKTTEDDTRDGDSSLDG